MGSKISISQEEENELYNLLQINQLEQKEKTKEAPSIQPAVMMRMMAPTALAPQQRVMQQNPRVKKQRGGKVPARQAYQAVQRR
jgi:hypothetical protein